MGHGHGHTDHRGGRAADRSRLRWVLLVTVAVLVVELVGAALAGSLALLADAGHLATDAGAVVLALGASYVASLRGGPRSTFGYHRAEVLAALLNAVVLLGVCVYLVWAGVARLGHPGHVDAGLMVLFAAFGLVANGVSMAILGRSETGSINLRGVATEVFADLVGAVVVVLAGVVILTTGWQRADPVASLVIAAMIAPRALLLLRDSAVVLLEIAPAGLDLGAVTATLREVPGVVDVHDLHAWTITSGIASLSAHVTVTDEALDRRGVGPILDQLCACVGEQYGVRHATFQVEPLSHESHEDLGELH